MAGGTQDGIGASAAAGLSAERGEEFLAHRRLVFTIA